MSSSTSSTITIDITQEELKAIGYYIEDPIDWLQKAWLGKANQRRKGFIQELTDKNVNKLSSDEQKQLVMNVQVDSCKQRIIKEKNDTLKRMPKENSAG